MKENKNICYQGDQEYISHHKCYQGEQEYISHHQGDVMLSRRSRIYITS